MHIYWMWSFAFFYEKCFNRNKLHSTSFEWASLCYSGANDHGTKENNKKAYTLVDKIKPSWRLPNFLMFSYELLMFSYPIPKKYKWIYMKAVAPTIVLNSVGNSSSSSRLPIQTIFLRIYPYTVIPDYGLSRRQWSHLSVSPLREYRPQKICWRIWHVWHPK